MRSFIFFISMLMLLSSCNLTDYLAPGETTTERRALLNDQFNHIDVEGLFDVRLVPDTVVFVEVSCPKNLQHLIKVELDSNILHLENGITARAISGYDWVKIDVHFKKLSTIYVYQPANIKSADTIRGDQLVVVGWTRMLECDIMVDVDNLIIDGERRGLSTFCFSGNATNCTIGVYKASTFLAEDLHVKNCDIITASVADVYLNVSDKLDAEIRSGGNIYYHGKPATSRSGNGSGQLLPLD